MGSLADFEVEVFYSSTFVQAKGFSGILRILLTENGDSKEKVFLNFVAVIWVAQFAPVLIKKNIITSEEVINECFYVFCDGQNVREASELLLSATDDYNQVVIHGISLLSVQKRKKFLSRLLHVAVSKSFGCLMRLIFGDELLNDEKQLLIMHILKNGNDKYVDIVSRTYSSICYDFLHYAVESPLRNEVVLKYCEDECVLRKVNLNYASCVFVLCERIINGPHQCVIGLVNNPTFPIHSSLVYPLLNAYASLSEWVKMPVLTSLLPQHSEFDNMPLTKTIQKISVLIERSQNVKLSKDMFEVDERDKRTLLDYFKWINDSRQRINSMLKFWRKYPMHCVSNAHICFISAFLPYLADDQIDDYLFLVGQFVQISVCLADGVLIFCLQLMKQSAEVRRKFLYWMYHLAVSKSAHGSVCKLLLTVAKSKDAKEGAVAIKSLENLWNFSRWSLFDEFIGVTKIDSDQPKSVCLAKFSLIRSICRKSDRSEELLPMLSALLNSNSEYLSEAISVVVELCAAQILEMQSVLKLLSPLMSVPQQINAVCGYVKLLSLSSGLPIEEPDHRFDCIKLLWQYTSDEYSPEVQSSAWKGLAAYSSELVQETLPNDKEEQPCFHFEIMNLLGKAENKTADGMHCFLSRLVSDEIEKIGRSLYIGNDGFDYGDNKLVEAGLKSFSWEKVMNINELAALALFGLYSASIYPFGRRISITLQRLYTMFTKIQIPLNDECMAVKYIISWKKTVESVYKFLSEIPSKRRPNQSAKASPSDQIIDVMKRALAASDLASVNVVISLSFLITCAEVELNTATEVAAEDFLFSCISAKHKCMSPSLFRQDVKHSEDLTVMSYFAVSRLFRMKDSVANYDYGYFSQILNKNEVFADKEWLVLTSGGKLGNAKNSNVVSLCQLFENIDLLRERHITSIKWKPSEIQLVALLIGANCDLVDCIIDRLCPPPAQNESFFTRWLEKERMTAEEIKEFFDDVSKSSFRLMKRFSGRLAKKLFDFLKCDDNDLHAIALQELAVIHLLHEYDCVSHKPNNYNYLSERSVLKLIIQKLQTDYCDSEAHIFLALLQSLCDYNARSDGRELPPLKWIFLYKLFLITNDDIQRCILQIAIRQKDIKLLCKLVTTEIFGNNFLEFWRLILDNIDILRRILPWPIMNFIINCLVNATSDDTLDQQIWDALALLAPYNQHVVESWSSKLPEITEAKVLDFPIYSSFKAVNIPKSVLSKSTLLHIWALTKTPLVEENTSLLMSLFKFLAKIPSKYSDEKRATALLVVACNVIGLTTELRSQAIKWLITDYYLNSKQTFLDIHLYWQVFLSFCSTHYSNEVPVFLMIDSDFEAWKWIESRIFSVFQGLLKDDNFLEISGDMAKFIISLLSALDESKEEGMEITKLKESMKELLQLMLSIIPSSTAKCLDLAQMWNKVFE